MQACKTPGNFYADRHYNRTRRTTPVIFDKTFGQNKSNKDFLNKSNYNFNT